MFHVKHLANYPGLRSPAGALGRCISRGPCISGGLQASRGCISRGLVAGTCCGPARISAQAFAKAAGPAARSGGGELAPAPAVGGFCDIVKRRSYAAGVVFESRAGYARRPGCAGRMDYAGCAAASPATATSSGAGCFSSFFVSTRNASAASETTPATTTTSTQVGT